jgi:hypothetical protein
MTTPQTPLKLSDILGYDNDGLVNLLNEWDLFRFLEGDDVLFVSDSDPLPISTPKGTGDLLSLKVFEGVCVRVVSMNLEQGLKLLGLKFVDKEKGDAVNVALSDTWQGNGRISDGPVFVIEPGLVQTLDGTDLTDRKLIVNSKGVVTMGGFLPDGTFDRRQCVPYVAPVEKAPEPAAAPVVLESPETTDGLGTIVVAGTTDDGTVKDTAVLEPGAADAEAHPDSPDTINEGKGIVVAEADGTLAPEPVPATDDATGQPADVAAAVPVPVTDDEAIAHEEGNSECPCLACENAELLARGLKPLVAGTAPEPVPVAAATEDDDTCGPTEEPLEIPELDDLEPDPDADGKPAPESTASIAETLAPAAHSAECGCDACVAMRGSDVPEPVV